MTGDRFLFPMDEEEAPPVAPPAPKKNRKPREKKPSKRPSSKSRSNTPAPPRLFVDQLDPVATPDTNAGSEVSTTTITKPKSKTESKTEPKPKPKSKSNSPTNVGEQTGDPPRAATLPPAEVVAIEASSTGDLLDGASEVADASLPPIENNLIRASAGTGKTYQLTSRFLRLLLLGVAPETILATTFTRKAAGEILDRVVSWLSHASVEPAELQKLAQAVAIPQLTHEACLSKLTTLTRQMHRLQIYTIDAFFMQMAKSFSLELGMTPGWQVLEEGGAESNSLRADAIAAVLRQESLEDLLTLVHQIAPKGEAKRSLDHTLLSSVNSAYRLFLQSSPDAWDRLEVPAPLPEDELNDVRAALAGYRDKRKTIAQALEQDVDRIVNEDWPGFFQSGKSLARAINEGATKYGNAKLPDDLIDLYHRFLPHLRSMTLFAARAQTLGTHQFLEKYHAEYSTLKEGQRLYGFDEVTELLAVYTQNGNPSQLAFRMDHGIDHLLLDEFQDTSTTQWRALAKLAKRCAGSDGRSFFCVGDVKQAIYGWRGGSSEIFDVLDKKLPKLVDSVLQESRRSSQVVMDAVNRIFQFLPEWDEKRLGRAQRAAQAWPFPLHTTFHQQMPGYFAIETSGEEKRLTKEAQESAVFRRAAERVAELSRKAPSRTIGILCRRNDKVGQMMNELQRLGIPASEEGGNYLTDSAAVELILSLLHLTDHPGDTVAAFHLAASPWSKQLGLSIDAQATNEKASNEKAQSDDDVPSTDRRRPAGGIDPMAIGRLVSQTRSQLLHDGFGDTIQRWARELRTFCNRREARRLTQLVERAYEYQSRIESPTQLGYHSQRRQSSRPTEFVRYIRETKFADPSSAKIRVMTVHQAKGLEFDIVILPDLLGPFIEGHETFLYRRPDIESEIDLVCRYMGKDSGRSFLPQKFLPLFDHYEDRSARESFCVLYVALTRAAHALHIFLPSGMQKLRGSKGHPGYLIKDAFLPGQELGTDQTVFAMGDADWFLQCESTTALEEADVETTTPTPRLARARETRKNLEMIAPSQIGRSRYVRVSDRLAPRKNAARDRGTVIHQWLAQIQWLDQSGALSDHELRELAAPYAATLDIEALLRDFKQLLQTDEVLDILDHERFWKDVHSQLPASLKESAGNLQLEARTEQRVAGRDGNKIVSGTMDRLVLIRSATGKLLAAEIIDYKTECDDGANEETREQRRDRYEMQIAAYRRALCSSLRIENVATRLVYLPC